MEKGVLDTLHLVKFGGFYARVEEGVRRVSYSGGVGVSLRWVCAQEVCGVCRGKRGGLAERCVRRGHGEFMC